MCFLSWQVAKSRITSDTLINYCQPNIVKSLSGGPTG